MRKLTARGRLVHREIALAKTAVEVVVLGEPHRRAGLPPERDDVVGLYERVGERVTGIGR